MTVVHALVNPADGKVLGIKDPDGVFVSPESVTAWLDDSKAYPPELKTASEARQNELKVWRRHFDESQNKRLADDLRKFGFHPNWGQKEIRKFAIVELDTDVAVEYVDLSEVYNEAELAQVHDPDKVSPIPA